MRLVVTDSSPLNYLVWIEQVETRLRYPHGCSAGGCADRAAADALFASKGSGGTVKPLWIAGMITATITDALARTARMRFPDLLAISAGA
jgi:hypothetical protein